MKKLRRRSSTTSLGVPRAAPVTLVFAAKDAEHNNAVVLARAIERRARRVAAAASRRRATATATAAKSSARPAPSPPGEVALGTVARSRAEWSACFDRRHCGPGDQRPTLASVTHGGLTA